MIIIHYNKLLTAVVNMNLVLEYVKLLVEELNCMLINLRDVIHIRRRVFYFIEKYELSYF